MRVPDITSTAGYVASLSQVSKNDTVSGDFGSSVSRFGGFEYKGANLRQPQNVYDIRANTSNAYGLEISYTSTADEFVQRALNSTSTQFSTGHNDPGHSELHKNRQTYSNHNGTDLADQKDVIGRDSGNTYTSFKEVFNDNRQFFDECIKSFDNIQALENSIEQQCTLPNQNDIRNDDDLNVNTIDDGNRSLITNHKMLDCDRSPIQNYPKLLNRCTFKEAESDQNLVLGTNEDSVDDIDDEDHSMTDLCFDSEKSSANNPNIEDESLKSPSPISIASSASISLRTSKCAYFPRGIINPNYPGFQHLAHTLSEHFVGAEPTETYDSDMSEYDEMELSADSFEDLPEEPDYSLNKYNNNNNQSNEQSINSFGIIHSLNKTMEIQSNQQDLASWSCNFVKQNPEQLNETTDLPNHLKTVLTLLEPIKCQNGNTVYNSHNKSIVTKNDITAHNLTTPDILIKNSLCTLNVEPRIKNRPDLLRGVSPQPTRCKFNIGHEDQTLSSLDIYNTIHIGNENGKEELSLGVTPVDIIGDFGEEVEREFGLLVPGYRKLIDNSSDLSQEIISCTSKGVDAELSNAKDQIDSNKFLSALNSVESNELSNNFIQTETKEIAEECIEECNIVDWSKVDSAVLDDENMCINHDRPKYQKPSYDERQLPPVAIDYKCSQQNIRSLRKPSHFDKNSLKIGNGNASRNQCKFNLNNRCSNSKRSGGSIVSAYRGSKFDQEGDFNRKRDEEELKQYRQLIKNKDSMLSSSRYTKTSSWAQYLSKVNKGQSSRSNTTELTSPSALELFNAYKIGSEIDMETLQKHLKMAKEIEKKRRSDREEIRRRLALGVEENSNERNKSSARQAGFQSSIRNGKSLCRANESSSDTESHSSDSETCPKLSKVKPQNSIESINNTNGGDKTIQPYNGQPLSVGCSNNNKHQQNPKRQHHDQQQMNSNMPLLAITNEDKECDFFTKQAKLQIEARMALAQAKEMAHMQMKIEMQNQRMSPITAIIRDSLSQVDVEMSVDKRRLSRQMLTEMNIAQLQVLVNNLHSHIEGLNNSLVLILMERDDLHMGQDTMLVDIEELTRYIGAKEQLAHLAQKGLKSKLCQPAK